jgi:flavin-dependent dehydrogenase
MQTSGQYDVAIIGGGPGGSTTASLLRKYNPTMKVLVLEREVMPREHIGESQLPPIGRVLEEMGVWDKVEAADFPIKFGATFTWGKTVEPWVFGFVPLEDIPDHIERPGKWEGFRQRVALQVDRARYDKILLDHAAEMGAEVRQGTKVVKVHHENRVVSGLELSDGSTVTARYYVDASGNAAVLRRDVGVEVHAPTLLRNVAFWDYWQRPKMNGRIWEKGSTRIHIRSIPHGWIWYIALGLDRTSVGVVCPAEFYKKSGKTPTQMLHDSLAMEPQVTEFITGSTNDGVTRSTTDWSYIADTTYGENWFLCGECLGFADPILSAGLTLTQTCGRHLAYVITELERGTHDPKWLKEGYNAVQRQRVIQHMRFAEYWYSANGFFSAIHENCSAITKDSGIKLAPQDAFRWLAHGGIDDELGQVVIGGLDLAGIKQIQWRLSEPGQKVEYFVHGKNVFKLNTVGAEEVEIPLLAEGRIYRAKAYQRGTISLPLVGGYGMMHDVLRQTSDAAEMMELLRRRIAMEHPPEVHSHIFNQALLCLEAMASNYWVQCSVKKGRPTIDMSTPKEGKLIYTQKLGPRVG